MLRRRAPRPLDRVLPAHPVPVVRGLPAAARARAAPARACSAPTTSSFQIGDYARHFRSSCLRVLGARLASRTGVEIDGRRVGIGVDPIGIDVAGFREVARRIRRRRGCSPTSRIAYEGRRLVLGVERLDYTKGIPQKLRAFERFLERDPARARTTTMIQVLVPVAAREPRVPRAARRDRAPRRAHQRALRAAGRRRRSSTSTATSRSRRSSRCTGAPTCMMVTALRDGMNLVAHEFVLCQSEPGLPGRWRGVAAAVRVRRRRAACCPARSSSTRGTWRASSSTSRTALALPARASGGGGSRRWRSGSRLLDSRRWADGVPHPARRATRARARPASADAVDAAIAGRGSASGSRARARRTIVLDYDGTLRELELHPDLAQPTPEILALLRDLAALPSTRRPHRQRASPPEPRAVVRPAADPPLRRARVPRASHRAASGATLLELDLSWLRPIERAAAARRGRRPGHARRAQVRAASPGTTAQAEPEYGSWRAHELLNDLAPAPRRSARGDPQGRRVVEVRAQGVNKGVYVRRLFPDGERRRRASCSALGDDRTDHDLLDALPPGAVAGHVGGLLPSSRNQDGTEDVHIVGPGEVRAFLRGLVESLA